MSEQPVDQSYPDLPEAIPTDTTVYTPVELDAYAAELQTILDGYALNEEKDSAYHQAKYRLQMAERGWMVVGPDHPKAREQLSQLMGNLGNTFNGVDRTSEFDPSLETPQESGVLLQRLPFVHGASLRKPQVPDHFEIEGKIELPLDSIIGAEGLENWAGRGIHLKDNRPSLDVIREYAARGKYDGSRGLLDAHVVRGSDGKYYLYLSSAHRAAAAKLRGDKSIIADSITLSSKPWEFTI